MKTYLAFKTRTVKVEEEYFEIILAFKTRTVKVEEEYFENIFGFQDGNSKSRRGIF